jgi:hypothetical protein
MVSVTTLICRCALNLRVSTDGSPSLGTNMLKIGKLR